MEQALAIAVKRLGEQHPQTVTIASWLADSARYTPNLELGFRRFPVESQLAIRFTAPRPILLESGLAAVLLYRFTFLRASILA